MKNHGTERPWQVREELGKILARHLGLVRDRTTMDKALQAVHALKARAAGVHLEDRGRAQDAVGCVD